MLDMDVILNDLKEFDEELHRNLNYLLESNDPDLEKNLGISFTTFVNKFGEQKLILLKVLVLVKKFHYRIKEIKFL